MEFVNPPGIDQLTTVEESGQHPLYNDFTELYNDDESVVDKGQESILSNIRENGMRSILDAAIKGSTESHTDVSEFDIKSFIYILWITILILIIFIQLMRIFIIQRKYKPYFFIRDTIDYVEMKRRRQRNIDVLKSEASIESMHHRGPSYGATTKNKFI